MNTSQKVKSIVQTVAGKPRSKERVRFRRAFGSTYNRDQRRWKDTPEVRAVLELADAEPTEIFPPAKGPVQKYLVGCNVRYTNFGREYTGMIKYASVVYNPNKFQDEIEYNIYNLSGSRHIYQDAILGLTE